jgi:hypothetical protein
LETEEQLDELLGITKPDVPKDGASENSVATDESFGNENASPDYYTVLENVKCCMQ